MYKRQVDTLKCAEYFAGNGSVLDEIRRNTVNWTTENVYKNIIPAPREIIRRENFLTFELLKSIVIRNKNCNPLAEFLNNWIKTYYDKDLNIILSDEIIDENCIEITLKEYVPNSNKEYYECSVSKKQIKLTANTDEGLFRGIQTLFQVLFLSLVTVNNKRELFFLPAVEIKDSPRFEWRGVMLDVARHFFSVNDVKRVIDTIALYKINKLHLHLTDDQGWRIHINSLPRLTAVGGASQVGGGKGGFYTKEDFKEIVEYASGKFITVVPEIDMPGHTNAALASYSELNKSGVAPAYYTETGVGFSSLDINNPNTYNFIRDVINELAEITPGPFIHIGGDEAKATDLEDYKIFIKKVSEIVSGTGKQLIGWEEISKCDLGQNTIFQFWDQKECLHISAEKGNKIIFSLSKKIYMDMKYDNNTPIGLIWAGCINLNTSYNWDPTTEIDELPESNILGVEAPLWTETVTNISEIEFMLFPRVIGVAEIGWSRKEDRNWENYKNRLAYHGKYLKSIKINFYQSDQINWK
ncbi:MAG: family 20 glycosylhydrolase [Ignavibacteriaceae bacterium]|nr:family 20 glycosylhydrolase [Ignavibacteriaceae bacterium]